MVQPRASLQKLNARLAQPASLVRSLDFQSHKHSVMLVLSVPVEQRLPNLGARLRAVRCASPEPSVLWIRFLQLRVLRESTASHMRPMFQLVTVRLVTIVPWAQLRRTPSASCASLVTTVQLGVLLWHLAQSVLTLWVWGHLRHQIASLALLEVTVTPVVLTQQQRTVQRATIVVEVRAQTTKSSVAPVTTVQADQLIKLYVSLEHTNHPKEQIRVCSAHR